MGRQKLVDVEAARQVPIIGVAQRLGLDRRARGRSDSWVARCPFHDDHHPSLRLDPSKGVWFCDPCGEGGDAIELYGRARGVDFMSAVRELANYPEAEVHAVVG